jgi:hypothetical protein
VQQVQYNVGSYEKGKSLLDYNSEEQIDFVTSAINQANGYLNYD